MSIVQAAFVNHLINELCMYVWEFPFPALVTNTLSKCWTLPCRVFLADFTLQLKDTSTIGFQCDASTTMVVCTFTARR